MGSPKIKSSDGHLNPKLGYLLLLLLLWHTNVSLLYYPILSNHCFTTNLQQICIALSILYIIYSNEEIILNSTLPTCRTSAHNHITCRIGVHQGEAGYGAQRWVMHWINGEDESSWICCVQLKSRKSRYSSFSQTILVAKLPTLCSYIVAVLLYWDVMMLVNVKFDASKCTRIAFQYYVLPWSSQFLIA